MYEYQAKYIRVVDGDTVDLDIDLGLDIHHQIRVRLYGINTPELHSSDPEEQKKAKEAKRYLEYSLLILPNLKSKDLIVKTVKDKTEKYGRYLAVIFADADPVAVNQKLLDAGLAVPYFGKNE
jgi:micrococcal nuclease